MYIMEFDKQTTISHILLIFASSFTTFTFHFTVLCTIIMHLRLTTFLLGLHHFIMMIACQLFSFFLFSSSFFIFHLFCLSYVFYSSPFSIS